MTQYIFVTGGVLSSLGKGLASASLAALLQARGYKVRLRKFDPYLNVDPGTMSPYQHGEVYVTDDGAETDLDLGHYERFTGISCRRSDSVTTGQVYSSVIAKERHGDYLGATVQVIPHITDEIKQRIVADVEEDIDFLICEAGGTVGDIEGQPYLEAFRQFAIDVGRKNVLFIHLTLVPYIASAAELKTKPSQHSVKELLSLGIQPDILLCRCDRPIPASAKHKLALFCNIKPECVIEALDVETIYEVPLSYSLAGLDSEVTKYFGLESIKPVNLKIWQDIVTNCKYPKGEVRIAVVGKYVECKDAYKSLIEALTHACISYNYKLRIDWVSADTLEISDGNRTVAVDDSILYEHLRDAQGILVPGGYGERGTVGKIAAITYARENDIPFFGICLGMQLAVIEIARNLAGLQEANSSEFSPSTPHPVVGLLEEWEEQGEKQTRSQDSDLGGTMRLGVQECKLLPGSLVHKIYNQDVIRERHRHRYEVNIAYKDKMEAVGLKITGISPDGKLPEMVELVGHPWFVAMQFHPEFKSQPMTPHPVFKAFIKAALERADVLKKGKVA